MTVGNLTIIIVGVLFFIFFGVELVGLPWSELISVIIDASGDVIILFIVFIVPILIGYVIGALVTWLCKHWDDKVFKGKQNNF